MSKADIRVIVGLDFGTTYTGFTTVHVGDPDNIITNEAWPGELGLFKTNTVLQYDEDLDKVVKWGNPALSEPPNPRRERNKRHVAELFKLHLGNLQADLKRKNPLPVEYKKAITDYLREIGKCIKKTVGCTIDGDSKGLDKITPRWSGGIDFFENVLLVLTVPAEYSEGSKATMRECAYEAGLIKDRYSEKLQFTTEPEAAAIYCMKSLREYDLDTSGTTFMIVDCGGGTVDLTTRKLLKEKQLGEVTERLGDYCGSTFVDKEFIKNLEGRFGEEPINLLKENNYGELQYMVQEFCKKAKLPFTGDDPSFHYELDIDDVCPELLEYLSDDMKEKLSDDVIVFDYNTVKSMFDPVIERILRMIRAQLDNSREKCSIMFLVGGFSTSLYLQKRIKEKFKDKVGAISVPTSPIAAISRGAAIYGLSLYNSDDMESMDGLRSIISSRVLKFTYGIEVISYWLPGDPEEKRFVGNIGLRFKTVAKRGTEAKVNEKFIIDELSPLFSQQSEANIDIYYTRKYSAEFCSEDGMRKLGTLKIVWPKEHVGKDRTFTFKLAFGQMEITAIATNDLDGQNQQVNFEINAEDDF